ncbi:hypothetical protein BELL_0039g00280 [Botrytis elliptica]|uniref:Uncharacterized protein n=1 Tax=Botrytis elliptica TaxID=278938 RepID=A0A4Z1K6W0_9HELO|nr:hypothetical protein EAE99_009084 [Botrytis elliptica]TGO79252.1 hypothetical protein BELL_0039g00280 [Botrytis elliptica]
MTTKLNLLVTPTQERRPVRHDVNEDKKSEKLRTMYLYTMMFLSIASPILHESSLIAWLINIFCTVALMVAVVRSHPEEIKKFGPVVLPTASLFLVMIVFTSRVSLLEIMPWIPFAFSVWLLITVYSCPATVSLVQEVLRGARLDSPKHGHYIQNFIWDVEEGQDQAPSFGFNQKEPLKRVSQSTMDHEVAFMGRPTSIISTTPSDIDLDEGNATARLVGARLLSHFREDNRESIQFLDDLRFHSQDNFTNSLESSDDSLIAHHSKIGSEFSDHI